MGRRWQPPPETTWLVFGIGRRESFYTRSSTTRLFMAAVFSHREEDLIATGSGDGTVSLWKATTGKLIAQRQEHADAVYCLSFAPDGKSDLPQSEAMERKAIRNAESGRCRLLRSKRFCPDTTDLGTVSCLGRVQARLMAIATSGGDKLVHIYARLYR